MLAPDDTRELSNTRVPAPWRVADAAPGRMGAYDRAARAAALHDGLLAEEIAAVLAGRRVSEAFPVLRGESLRVYAERAVAEMMVAYLG